MTTLPPANIRAEKALLGSLLIDPSMLVSVLDVVNSDDFYIAKHGVIYTALIDMHRQRTKVDFLTLVEHLQRVGQMDGKKDEAYIASLVAAVPSSIHAPEYAASVMRAAWLRRMITASAELTKQAYTDGADIDDIYTEAQEIIRRLIPPAGDDAMLYGWDVAGFLAEILNESIVKNEKGVISDFDWPWSSWNQRILPLEGGLLAMLTGAEGSGKSTYLSHIAEHWAQNGKQVALVHWEDSKRKKIRRRTTRHTKVDYRRIFMGEVTRDEQNRIHRIQATIDRTWGKNLHYFHATGRTLPQVLNRMAREISEGRCDVVLFDYLNKIKRSKYQLKEEPWQSWANMMDDMKQFSEQHDIPAITAGQMNKSGKDGLDLVGTGIRGSGEIVDKAQLVLNIYRSKVENAVKDGNGKIIADVGDRSPRCEIGIVKQNDGTGGKWEQFFYGSLFRIKDPK